MKKKIIIAPLNWGIGHATRCVPIINELLKNGFEPIITSDSDALRYLEKEFPKLQSFELPSYDIQYSSKAFFFKLKLLFQIPKIYKAIAEENKIIQQIITEENIQGIISDNRFGVYSKKNPSIYVTHQLNVFSGITTFFTSKIHQKMMKNFDEIWVPDNKKLNLSGKLSKISNFKIPIQFIGVLSRFKEEKIQNTTYKYDILVLLSGTEPQRSILENILIKELSATSKKILFIRGKIAPKQNIEDTKNITFVNFLSQDKLKTAILESELVIARSGYSTIMDLAVLHKKAFFIPTPNQQEQEYLARYLDKLKIAPFSSQNNFKVEMLNKTSNYTGFVAHFSKEALNFELFLK